MWFSCFDNYFVLTRPLYLSPFANKHQLPIAKVNKRLCDLDIAGRCRNDPWLADWRTEQHVDSGKNDGLKWRIAVPFRQRNNFYCYSAIDIFTFLQALISCSSNTTQQSLSGVFFTRIKTGHGGRRVVVGSETGSYFCPCWLGIGCGVGCSDFDFFSHFEV